MPDPGRTSEKPGTGLRFDRRGGLYGFAALVVGVLVLCYFTVTAVDRFGPALFFAPALILLLFLFGIRIFSTPLQVLSLFLLLIVNLDFFRVSKTPLTADILVSAMILYMLLVRGALVGGFRLRGGVEKAYALYLGVTLVSVVLSVSVGNSVKNWSRDLEYLILFIFFISLRMQASERDGVVRACLLSSIIPCFLGLIGWMFGIDAFYGQETPIAGGESVARIQSTLSHPVVFSHYLSFIGIVTLSRLIGDPRARRSWWSVLFGLDMFLLYLTFGRTGWVEFIVGCVALFWLHGRKRILFLGLPATAVLISVAVPTLIARFQDVSESKENSLVWRFGLWAYALSKFPDRPFFGSGQDTFIEYVAYDTGFAAHHTWVGLLIETGIAGTLAFLILNILIGVALKRRRSEPDGARDPLVLGVTAGWIGLLAGTFAGDPFNLPVVAVYFWVLLALALNRSRAEA